MKSLFATIVIASSFWFCVGCSNEATLMPTPNLYRHADVNPFAEVPPTLQTNTADVLYLTDREPEKPEPGQPTLRVQALAIRCVWRE